MIQNPFAILCRFQQHGAGAVAENDADCTVCVVRHGGIDVRTDHQHFLVLAGFNELDARVQGVQKSRTSRRDVKSPGILNSELVLDQARRRRIHHVRRYGSHNDQVDFLQIEWVGFEQVPDRGDG